VDPDVPLADTIGAMGELVRSGKVSHLGVSEVNPEQLRQAAAVHPITAVQFEWSLLWREPEDDVVPVARSLGIGLIPYSPLGRGMLTEARPLSSYAPGDFRGSDPRFGAEHLEQNLAQVAALRAIAREKEISVGQLALAWLIAQGPDVVPIPGTRTAARAADNAGAGDLVLDASDLRRIDALVPREGWGGDRMSFAAHGQARSPGSRPQPRTSAKAV
jgi:aryl-alcohol dehydrogenase-like predicted oxidoreductase